MKVAFDVEALSGMSGGAMSSLTKLEWRGKNSLTGKHKSPPFIQAVFPLLVFRARPGGVRLPPPGTREGGA